MNRKTVRGLLSQVAVLGAIAALALYLFSNTVANLNARGIQSGLDFLSQRASFSIGEGVIAFEPSDSYARALVVGLTNTLRVAALAIVFSTIVGVLVAIGRLSNNGLLRAISATYVEALRNVPLLLQLFIWYFVLTELLPSIEEAVRPFPHVFLSKNGLQFPVPVWMPAHAYACAGAVAGLVGTWAWSRRMRLSQQSATASMRVFGLACVGAAAGAFMAWLAGGAQGQWDLPTKTDLSVVGGGSVSPEFLTLLLGLTTYTGAYIAEVVRAGLQSIPVGQRNASAALGMTRAQELRLILLPQAFRVIVPPLTTQYLNVFKNSSLAVAIGYPDLVSVSNTTLSQTGRALECVAIVASCYLALSLVTSALMAVYKRRQFLAP